MDTPPPKRPVIYAHRGASILLPENTLPAFEAALEQGADALETDVHLTKDGHVVVAHDVDGVRMAGVRRRIAKCRLEEIKGWNVGWGFVDRHGERPYRDKPLRMPTLVELLDAFPDARINLDMKTLSPALPIRMWGLLSLRPDLDRIQVSSFHNRHVVLMRAMGFPGPLVLSALEAFSTLLVPAPILKPILGPRRRLQVPTHHSGIPLGRPWVVERCRHLGLEVDIFTINDPAAAIEVAEMGFDGIMTDDPETIIAALRRAPPEQR